MRKYYGVVVLVLIALISSCSRPSGYTVEGQIDNYDGKMVYLEKLSGQLVQLDSTDISSNGGKFRFVGNADERGVYRLNFGNKRAVDLVLDNTSDIKVKLDATKSMIDYTVEGSDASLKLKEANTILFNTYQDINKLQEEFIKNQNSPDIKLISDSLEKRYMQLVNNQITELKKLIDSNTDPIVDVYALSYFDIAEHFDYIDQAFAEHMDMIGKSTYVKQFHDKYSVYKKLAVGQPAPDIILPDPTGKPVALSSLRGKVVMIDFWASWCGPCRQENPNVVKLFKQYKDKGFTVYGVSLDKTKEEWTKAIMHDGLTWTHVSDLKFWKSAGAATYNIQSIPATVLVDRDGKILAKNLRGEALAEFLKKLFN